MEFRDRREHKPLERQSRDLSTAGFELLKVEGD